MNTKGNSYKDGEHLLSAAELMEDDLLPIEHSLASGTVDPAQSLASTKNLSIEPAQSLASTKDLSIEPSLSLGSTKNLSIEPVSQESRMQGLASTEASRGGEKVKAQPIPVPHSLQEQEHGEVQNLKKPLKKVLSIA